MPRDETGEHHGEPTGGRVAIRDGRDPDVRYQDSHGQAYEAGWPAPARVAIPASSARSSDDRY